MKKKTLKGRRKLIGAWILILFVFALILEGVLWLLPLSNKYTIEHFIHEDFGIWHRPNQIGTNSTQCFSIKEIKINSLGMRGEEPDPNKEKKVAFFGDSFLEGNQVEEKDHFISMLNIEDHKIDYLNFGMSSTGTTAQLANFLYHSEKINFDHVYLFFFLANDIRNNSLVFETRLNGGNRGYLPHFVKNIKDGGYKWDKNYSMMKKIKFLKKSRVLSKLNELRHVLRRMRIGNSKNRMLFGLEVFAKKYTSEWEEAHKVTNYSLDYFSRVCKERKINFTIVLIPSMTELLNEEEIEKYHGAYKDQLDFLKPYLEYLKYLKMKGIDFIDFSQIAKKYIKDNQLSYPYLSYTCDGHFAPIGHRLLTDVIMDHLKTNLN